MHYISVVVPVQWVDDNDCVRTFCCACVVVPVQWVDVTLTVCIVHYISFVVPILLVDVTPTILLCCFLQYSGDLSLPLLHLLFLPQVSLH